MVVPCKKSAAQRARSCPAIPVQAKRGSAMVTSMSALLLVFMIGSATLSMSFQGASRSQLDVLRARSLALAEAGAEKGLHYLRTTAPNGARNGWRTSSLVESVVGQGDYTLTVEDGTGDNAGKVVVTSIGRATDGSVAVRRGVRVAVLVEREDISIWNNVIFGGVGQGGRSINGNVRIRGSVHLLGDGEDYTDQDGDGRWDAGETFTDNNGNGVWNAGEPYTDADSDGRYDSREPFVDINGNGNCDPPLTVTDLSTELGGTANIGNNYTGMPSLLQGKIPSITPTNYRSEPVQSLNAKLRVKHGRVDVSGNATVGDQQQTGGSPAVKEPLNGTFVSDGFGGNAGAASVYSDNGTSLKYNLGNMVQFPDLITPMVINGTSYTSYMQYLAGQALVINSPITLTPGTPFGPVSDGRGNMLAVDASGNIVIRGIVYVNGDIRTQRNGGNRSMTYSGRGTLVSTGNVHISTDLLPTGTFPTHSALGIVARRRCELATGSGDSQLTMAAAVYAQEQILSYKQNAIAGTFVTSYFNMQNVPDIYQVPSLVDNLPPGMPGSGRIWIKTIRTDSWREITVTGGSVWRGAAAGSVPTGVAVSE